MCDSEIDEGCCTPPEVAEMANIATLKLLPEKSRKVYEISYNRFREWCANKGAVQFTENVLLAFFSDRSTKIKPSSLWSEYSMVRASLSVKDNVDIKKYAKLMAFMKRNSVGFRSKKSKIFNREQIYTFLKEAPESEYLMKKISTIHDLEDGKGYVCSGKGEPFKNIDYSDLPTEKNGQNTANSKVIPALDQYSLARNEVPKCVKPKHIVVICNGITRPRKIFRVFLSKRNALTMEQVLRVISDAARLNTGPVKKIFSSRGCLMRQLEDIFDDFNQGVFFVYGSEKYKHEDFNLTPQEINELELQKK